MEDLFDILIPLVIAGVYFFGNMLSKKSGDEKREGSPVPRQKGRREVDPEEAERIRRVREEIRKKIEARRDGAPAQPAMPGSPNMPEPARTVRERTKSTNERVHETRTKPVAVPVPEILPESSKTESVFNWDESDDVYENTMQSQMAQIEATRKKAAALKARSAAASKKLSVKKRKSARSATPRLHGPVRSTLRDPGAARTAFIYGEILGSPVALRKSGSGALKAS